MEALGVGRGPVVGDDGRRKHEDQEGDLQQAHGYTNPSIVPVPDEKVSVSTPNF